MNLVSRLKAEGILRSPTTIMAMSIIPREEFVLENMKDSAYIDSPLPIYDGQTISAPHMVAIMCEVLELAPGQKVLEVGAGSGYHAAVTAEIVAPSDSHLKGHVYTVEIHKRLGEFARKNLEKTRYNDRVTVIEGDGSKGLPEEAPFERILVTATAPSIPKPLTDQLKTDGILVIPVGDLYAFQELILARKRGDGVIDTKGVCGVAFVPLLGKYGWREK